MLSRLILTDFRNHAEAALHPGRGFVVPRAQAPQSSLRKSRASSPVSA